MKGLPPHKLVNLRGEGICDGHVVCPRCGYDLCGAKTPQFMQAMFQDVSNAPVPVICPECGATSFALETTNPAEAPDPAALQPRLAGSAPPDVPDALDGGETPQSRSSVFTPAVGKQVAGTADGRKHSPPMRKMFIAPEYRRVASETQQGLVFGMLCLLLILGSCMFFALIYALGNQLGSSAAASGDPASVICPGVGLLMIIPMAWGLWRFGKVFEAPNRRRRR